MRIKVDKLDTKFSLLIRERARWRCEYCGRYFPEGERGGLSCSHFIGRRKRSVRYDPDNAAAMCYACHMKCEENPLDFATWVRLRLGDERYDDLRQRASYPLKLTKVDREALYTHLKEQLKKQEKAHREGYETEAERWEL